MVDQHQSPEKKQEIKEKMKIWTNKRESAQRRVLITRRSRRVPMDCKLLMVVWLQMSIDFFHHIMVRKAFEI